MKDSRADVYYVRFKGPKPGLVGKTILAEEGESSDNQTTVEEQTQSNRGEPVTPGLTMSGVYTTAEVSRLFEVSESRLRYWDRSGFLSPTGVDRGKRKYTFQDLIAIRSAITLIDKGLSLQKARKLLVDLREKVPASIHPLGCLRIMSDAQTVIVTTDDHEFEADSGQLLLNFSIRALEETVVKELPGPLDEKSRTAYEWYLEGCRLDEDMTTSKAAEEAYYKAIHLDPTLSNAYTNLGNLLFRSGSGSDAKALYHKAIEVDPQQAEAHYNLGFLYFEDGNTERARDCFLKSVDLDPDFADAHFNLAMSFLRLDLETQAKEHLGRYLDLEPSGPWAELAKQRLREN